MKSNEFLSVFSIKLRKNQMNFLANYRKKISTIYKKPDDISALFWY